MIAADKYSLLNRGNLTQPIKMLLSENGKAFSALWFAFSQSPLNSEHFQKKVDPHSSGIFEIPDCETRD